MLDRTASPFIRDRTMGAERSIVTELTQLMKTPVKSTVADYHRLIESTLDYDPLPITSSHPMLTAFEVMLRHFILWNNLQTFAKLLSCF